MMIEQIESPAPGTASARRVRRGRIDRPAPGSAAASEDALAEFDMPEIVATPMSPAAVLRLIDEDRRKGGHDGPE